MKPVKGPRLGSGPQHQKLMLGNLASALILHERIRTTQTKAKRLVPVADRLVTLGKAGSVHARRQALSIVEDRTVVHKLFAEIAPRYAERPGGYTRVVRLGPRHGDAAPMAIIEFVEDTGIGRPGAEEAEANRRGRRRGRKAEEKPKATAGKTPEATEPEEPEAAAEEAPAAEAETAEVAEASQAPEAEEGAEAEPEATADASEEKPEA